MKQADLAAALGIDPALVTLRKRRGMPVDSVEAARAWCTENIRARANEKGTENAPVDYQAARARREAAEAELAELKLAEAKQTLVNREQATRAAFTAFRHLRDALLSLPRKLAHGVVTAQTAHEAEKMLTDGIREALELFANRTLPEATGTEPVAD